MGMTQWGNSLRLWPLSVTTVPVDISGHDKMFFPPADLHKKPKMSYIISPRRNDK